MNYAGVLINESSVVIINTEKVTKYSPERAMENLSGLNALGKILKTCLGERYDY